VVKDGEESGRVNGDRGCTTEICVKKIGKKKVKLEEVYYTGPEERFKHTADEGGPKVIVRCDEERVNEDEKKY